MKKISLFLVGTILLLQSTPSNLMAQVTFPAGTNLCETTPWKLVWYDEFNGSSTSVDPNKWVTFSGNGDWKPGGGLYEPPTSVGARQGVKANYLDANVTVSNGTCKLTAKYQPNDWMGTTKPLSSGYMAAISRDANGPNTQFFNKGKFVIRARMPQVRDVSATYWLWGGATSTNGKPGGSEIDIYEYVPENNDASGDNSLNDFRFTLHGWNRPSSPNNSTSTQSHVHINTGAWHEYSCEWDENFVNLYVDGSLYVSRPRYTVQADFSSSGCTPVTNVSYVNDVYASFPYGDEYMAMICSLDFLEDRDINASMPDRVYEIDYVRVYQRTPQSGFHDVCGTISGPAQICTDNVNTTYTYNGDGLALGGVWQVSPNLSIVSSTGNSVTVKRLNAFQLTGTISVVNANMYCPSNTLTINTGIPSPTASVTSTFTAGHYSNSLHAVNVAPNTTYSWNIVTSLSPRTAVQPTGTSASAVSNYTPLCFEIRATGACGSTYTDYGNCTFVQKPGRSNADSTENTNEMADGKLAVKLFPNPAQNKLNVSLENTLVADGSIQVRIIDINGKDVYSGSYQINDERNFVIDISKFTSGIYLVDFSNGSQIVHDKFIKQ